MTLSAILPWIVIGAVALLVLRVVMGAIKASLSVMFWIVILAAAGLGWIWFQGQP